MNPEYNELVIRVRGIDPEAAEYLLYEAPKLYKFRPEDSLFNCFYWDNTPQGDNYWKKLFFEDWDNSRKQKIS